MTTYQKIKKRTFEIIEKGEKGDTVSKIFDFFILVLICVNVLSVFVETFKISRRASGKTFKILKREFTIF